MREGNCNQELQGEGGTAHKKATDMNKYGLQDGTDGCTICNCWNDANRMPGGRKNA